MIEYLSGEGKIGREGECRRSSEENRRPRQSRRWCEDSCRRSRFHWQLCESDERRWMKEEKWMNKSEYNMTNKIKYIIRNEEDEAWSMPTSDKDAGSVNRIQYRETIINNSRIDPREI